MSAKAESKWCITHLVLTSLMSHRRCHRLYSPLYLMGSQSPISLRIQSPRHRSRDRFRKAQKAGCKNQPESKPAKSRSCLPHRTEIASTRHAPLLQAIDRSLQQTPPRRVGNSQPIYLSSALAPASSSFFLAASASALGMPSLRVLGAPSTRSLASFKPRPVISRTTLITPTF